jgi:hypothetical protein
MMKIVSQKAMVGFWPLGSRIWTKKLSYSTGSTLLAEGVSNGSDAS